MTRGVTSEPPAGSGDWGIMRLQRASPGPLGCCPAERTLRLPPAAAPRLRRFPLPPGRAAAARPSFEYVVKAPQLYSHRKRLHVDDAFRESWGRFWVGLKGEFGQLARWGGHRVRAMACPAGGHACASRRSTKRGRGWCSDPTGSGNVPVRRSPLPAGALPAAAASPGTHPLPGTYHWGGGVVPGCWCGGVGQGQGAEAAAQPPACASTALSRPRLPPPTRPPA